MIGLALLIAATSLVVARVHAWLVVPYLLLMGWILLSPRGGSKATSGSPAAPETPATTPPDPVERPGWFSRRSQRPDPPESLPRSGHADAPAGRGSGISGWFARRQPSTVADLAVDPEPDRERALRGDRLATVDAASAEPSKEATAVESPSKPRKRRRRRASEPEPEPEPSEIVWVRVGPSQFVRQEIPVVAAEGEQARLEPSDAPPGLESTAPTADHPNVPEAPPEVPFDPSGFSTPAAPEPESWPAIPDLVESTEAVEAPRFVEPTSEFDATSPDVEPSDDRSETSEGDDDPFQGGTAHSPPIEDATGLDAPDGDEDEPDIEDDGPVDDDPDRPTDGIGPSRGIGGPDLEASDIEDDQDDNPDRRQDFENDDDDRWDEDDDWDDDASALAEAIAGDAAGPAPGPPPEPIDDRGLEGNAEGVIGYGQDFQSYLQDLIQMAGGVDGPAMQALGPPPSDRPVRSSPPPVPEMAGTTAPTPREPEAPRAVGDRGAAGDDEDDAAGPRATVRAPDASSMSADPSPPCPDDPQTSRDAQSATSESPSPSRRPRNLDPTLDPPTQPGGLMPPRSGLSRSVLADRPETFPHDRPDRQDYDRRSRRDAGPRGHRRLGDNAPGRCLAPRSNRPRAPPRSRTPGCVRKHPEPPP